MFFLRFFRKFAKKSSRTYEIGVSNIQNYSVIYKIILLHEIKVAIMKKFVNEDTFISICLNFVLRWLE